MASTGSALGAVAFVTDPLPPGLSGPAVYDLTVLDSGRVIIGGSFTAIGAFPRSNVGAILPTGKPDQAFAGQTVGGSAVEGAVPLVEVIYNAGGGDVKHDRTGQVVAPKFPYEHPDVNPALRGQPRPGPSAAGGERGSRLGGERSVRMTVKRPDRVRSGGVVVDVDVAGHRGRIGRGGSAILAPDGAYLAGPLWEEEGVLYATLEPQKLLEERQRFDPVGHYNRPDVFQLAVREPTII